MKKHEEVLKKVLEKVRPSKEELEEINFRIKNFLKRVNERIKEEKIDAEAFVGGSFAKKTVIRKGKYDVDIFVRYGKKHAYDDLSLLTSRILKDFKEISRVHGSRDYFVIEQTPSFFIEAIPVKKISKSSEAENITDLSYSHVHYINKKIKSEKMLDEIRIAKAFCHATNTYGAESYIKGFSGYGLELLIYHYKTFLNFAKAMSKGEGKVMIDIEKYYKNNKQILMDVNSAKLSSPVILIDPTYMQRNVLAALSEETFERFKEECRKFLKNPSISMFEVKKQDIEKLIKDSKSKKEDFVILEIKTSKQAGDIAGSKLLKFFNHLKKEIEKRFEIKKEDFSYDGEKKAKVFLSATPKKKIVLSGPLSSDVKNAIAFKKMHKKVTIKNKRLVAEEAPEKNLGKFISAWVKKNQGKIQDMTIEEVILI